MKNTNSDGLSFEIDFSNHIAKTVFSPKVQGKIVIPRSIWYESQEFNITIISKGTFKNNNNISSISFPEDSEVQTIEEEAFSCSSLTQISIPSSLKELKEDWCAFTWRLKQVFISPKNKYFSILDEKMVLGKSQSNIDYYDILVFACRDIERAIIPSTIQKIDSFAFSGCMNLQFVDFSENSELRLIEKNAFLTSSIRKITIPEKVVEIKDGWCSSTWHLNELSISPLNQTFKYIDNDKKLIAKKRNESDSFYEILFFACRDIKKAIIPSYITEISSFAFHQCQNLTTIEFERNSKLYAIGQFAFSFSSIEKIIIPRHVKLIDEFTFCRCLCLSQIEFEDNSEIYKISKESFSVLAIESISIPSSVTTIEEHAFFHCDTLQQVIFQNDSKLRTIGKEAFSHSMLEKLVIPRHLTTIGENAFSEIFSHFKVDFADDSDLLSFDEHSFSYSPIEELTFPPNLRELKEGWCAFTSKFVHILISPQNRFFSHSNLNEKLIVGKSNLNNDFYDNLVFASRDIDYALIPSNIKNINHYSFHQCRNLREIEFEKNSELNSIGNFAFNDTSLAEISIPSSVKHIGKFAFSCRNLKKVTFPEDSQILSIGECSFMDTQIDKVEIPISIRKIGPEAFNCRNVQTVEIFGERFYVDNFLCTYASVFSFPEAREVSYSKKAFFSQNSDCYLFVFPGSKLTQVLD
ncbi:hypothetical protein M9Y10_014189 [Tritrichomonas musculus]|uniref:Surface antigen BspA-like n=1 Tax=Tritrichomonas musculus TaxID=1915356 RepID=A0ABR2KZF7_9EUKA